MDKREKRRIVSQVPRCFRDLSHVVKTRIGGFAVRAVSASVSTAGSASEVIPGGENVQPSLYGVVQPFDQCLVVAVGLCQTDQIVSAVFLINLFQLLINALRQAGFAQTGKVIVVCRRQNVGILHTPTLAAVGSAGQRLTTLRTFTHFHFVS